MKNKWNIAIMVLIAAFLIGWGMIMAHLLKGTEVAETENVLLTQKIDSLKSQLVISDSLSAIKEAELKNRLKVTDSTYQAKLNRIIGRHKEAKEKSKILPLTDQVIELKDNLWQSDSTPVIKEIDGQSFVLITPFDVECINADYEELRSLNEQNELCKDSRDSLYTMVVDAMNLLDTKDDDIATYQTIMKDQSTIIINKDAELKAKDKANRKKERTKQLMTGVMGFFFGVTLMAF